MIPTLMLNDYWTILIVNLLGFWFPETKASNFIYIFWSNEMIPRIISEFYSVSGIETEPWLFFRSLLSTSEASTIFWGSWDCEKKWLEP